jgi:peptidyl-prolyl cis-trans isomerase C
MKSAKTLTVLFVVGSFVVPALIGANPKKSDPKAPDAPVAKADAAADPTIPDPVAVVEGAPIKKSEIEERLSLWLSRQGASTADIPADQKLILFHQILDDLIDERLLDKHDKEVKVSEEEVNGLIDRLTKEIGSPEELTKQLAVQGKTVDQMKSDFRESLRRDHWLDTQIKGKAEVTDADVEDFYKKNPERFKQTEQVRASHILVSVPEGAKPEVITEKQTQAQALADRAKKGEDFNKLAEQLSEDPDAKENKGDLGFFGKDQINPGFADVANTAFGMKKGDVSAPVRSKLGFHVIKVTDRKEAGTLSLDEVKPELLSQMKRRKEGEEEHKVMEALRVSSGVKVNLPPVPTPPPDAVAPGAAAPGAPTPGSAAPAPAAATPATATPAATPAPAKAGKKGK